MNAKQTRLATGVALVGYLLGAFGGFKTYTAPPLNPLTGTTSNFAIGVASFSALFILLVVSAISRSWSKRKHRRIWIGCSAVMFGGFMLTSWVYFGRLQEYSFRYPDVENASVYHIGLEPTPRGASYIQTNSSLTWSKIIDEFGGIDQISYIWTPASIHRLQRYFVALYVVMLISMAGAIFGLTEGFFGTTERKPDRVSGDPHKDTNFTKAAEPNKGMQGATGAAGSSS